MYDPAWFVAQQLPQEKPLVASENSVVLAQQLGNMYLGMCLVGLSLFWTTSEPKVIRNYLVALLIADAGHVGFTCYGMGAARFLDVAGWNAMAWGNLGATVGTLALCLRIRLLACLIVSGVVVAGRAKWLDQEGVGGGSALLDAFAGTAANLAA